MLTWEVVLNYCAMHALARAMVAAGTVKGPVAIRAALPKAFPLRGKHFHRNSMGSHRQGVWKFTGSVQTQSERAGKDSPVRLVAWWLKTRAISTKLYSRRNRSTAAGSVDV